MSSDTAELLKILVPVLTPVAGALAFALKWFPAQINKKDDLIERQSATLQTLSTTTTAALEKNTAAQVEARAQLERLTTAVDRNAQMLTEMRGSLPRQTRTRATKGAD